MTPSSRYQPFTMTTSNTYISIFYETGNENVSETGSETLVNENNRLRSLNETLELEIQEVDRQHQLLRTHQYEEVDGWTRHLSWVDRPGEFYWYCSETGECQWDQGEGEVNEPNWWSRASYSSD